MDIAVTGATGAVGGRVARRLAARGVSFRMLVRDPARAPALEGTEVATASYDDREAMARALAGVRTLFLVSASEAAGRVDQHRTAVAAAAAAGVRRVVYTSFLAAAPDATFTFGRDHFHTEVALREAGLTTVALRDSLYQDVLPWFGADGTIRGPAGDGHFSPVARDDIADVAVEVLLDPEHPDTNHDVTGPELLTMHDVAATITRVTGHDVRYHPETLEEAYASRAEFGASDWEVGGWVTSYAAIATGELAKVADTVPRLTGREATSFADYLAAAQGLPWNRGDAGA